MNESKSYILDLGVDWKIRKSLQKVYPFTWKDESIPYLGTILTMFPDSLYSANYLPLIGKLKNQLSHLTQHELLWSGCLAAFKMQLLLHIIYTFRTVPIPVLQSFFNMLKSIVNKYLWQGKKAHCAFRQLIKLRMAGGVLTNRSMGLLSSRKSSAK